MADEDKKKDEWYLGKHIWEGMKTVGRTVREHPVAGTVGGIGGFIVGGPLGAAAGAVGASGIAKAVKEGEEKK